MEKVRILGIDLGSREVKMVLYEYGRIIRKNKISTMRFYRDYCIKDNGLIIDKEKLDIGEFDIGISTGYGRNNINIRDFTPINEVKAHIYGAIFQTGLEDFILLDLGGQDVKIVRVEKGVMTDIELNDKCAASCGRYLENMANILEVDLDYMTKFYKEPIELNSTCAVFSESELIGKIAEGVSIERLCAGVNYSLYKRLSPMLTRFKSNRIVLSGGASLNSALIEYLKNDYNEVITLEDAQFNGAIGCCYYGERMGLK
jgi:predicted CoA-substrate-specific enzyme activase